MPSVTEDGGEVKPDYSLREDSRAKVAALETAAQRSAPMSRAPLPRRGKNQVDAARQREYNKDACGSFAG